MNQKSAILGSRASSPVARFHFGLSGTGRDVMHHFGFSVSNIKKNVNKLIKKNR